MPAKIPTSPAAEQRNPISQVILGSATGTLIEWYDFYIFGSLTAVLAPKFYPPGNDTFALIAYLATFAVGFLVRPFGALFFGRIGDLVGRRIAFIITLTIMGGSTAAIGILPTFKSAGWFSPVVLILIRMLQGLALGGEYGGAAVYVAEHVEDRKRGFFTSFIQITASLGLFMSLLVIVLTQQSMSPASFQAWGWRLPFLLSLVLVTISLFIRIRMKESPIFQQIKSAGMHSAKPLTDAFTHWANLKQVLISLFGATAGQGVVWYTGQFYALFYLQTILRVNPRTANILVAVALVFAMPFYTVFGALSDRIGRKKLMMAALLISLLAYIPIYKAMQQAAGNNVVSVSSVKDKVTGAIKLTPLTSDAATGKLVPAKEAATANYPLLVALIFVQVVFGCMIYGPIAAYLVEAFPAKIRYTSVSLPYHVGNGVFGGLLPLIGLSLCAGTGNIYAGLYYPIAVCALTFLVGSVFLRETHGTLIWQEIARPAESPAQD
ncbi:MHS family MFS transporter [Acidobacteria bacterium AB60]|nr:MHS family MFS transporter [Acidobacteria bacterium AB60]